MKALTFVSYDLYSDIFYNRAISNQFFLSIDFLLFLQIFLIRGIDAAMTPVVIATGITAGPKIPNPRAPNDCNVAKPDPAATAPIAEWAAAAVEPAKTPALVNPTAEMTTLETALTPKTAPVPMTRFFPELTRTLLLILFNFLFL